MDGGGRTPLDFLLPDGGEQGEGGRASSATSPISDALVTGASEEKAVVRGSIERCLNMCERESAAWEGRVARLRSDHRSRLHRAAREYKKRLAIKDLALAELARESRRTDASATSPISDALVTGASEEKAVVRGSIERCLNMCERESAAWEGRVARLRSDHRSRLHRAAREYKKRLAIKDLALAELARESRRTDARVQELLNEIQDRDLKIGRKIRAEEALMTQVTGLDGEIMELKGRNLTLVDMVSELEGTVERNEFKIDQYNNKVSDLTSDLKHICSLHEGVTHSELVMAEANMTRAANAQIRLADRLRKQRDAVRSMLDHRDIDMPVGASNSVVGEVLGGIVGGEAEDDLNFKDIEDSDEDGVGSGATTTTEEDDPADQSMGDVAEMVAATAAKFLEVE